MKKYRIACNGLTAAAAAAGVWLNFLEPNAAKNTMLYFTTQSNLWMLGVCLLMVLYDVPGREVPRTVYIVKFSFTVSILITGVVYNLILAPQFALYYGSIGKAYSLSVVILHVIVPLLSLASFLLFDRLAPARGLWLSGTVMPMLYFLFILALSALGGEEGAFVGIDGKPSKFPYFFLDYIRNGWFTLSGGIGRLGTFYWLVIGLLLAALLGRLLLRLKRAVPSVELLRK